LTGCTAISIYSEQIFVILESHGLNMSASTGSTLIGIASLAGQIVAIPVSQKLKYKTMFAGCFLAMAVVDIGCVLGLLLHIPLLTVYCLLIYFFVMNTAVAANTFAYIGRSCESAGVSIASTALWVTLLILALTTETMFNALTPAGTFILFGVCCLIAGIFSLTYLKEIYGLSSEYAKTVYRPPQMANQMTAFM
jgi:hypothetical protein